MAHSLQRIIIASTISFFVGMVNDAVWIGYYHQNGKRGVREYISSMENGVERDTITKQVIYLKNWESRNK